MNRTHTLKAFSILESYTVLCIVAILMLIAIPEYNQILMREERELTLERLETAIEFAKQEAYRREKTVSLCASLNQKTCHKGSWTRGFMVVAETDILQIYPKLQYGTLHFDQFGQYLNFKPNGSSINNGTFTYCPKNLDEKEANALIMNKAGRTYRPINRNILGIYEKQEGTPEAKPLTCR